MFAHRIRKRVAVIIAHHSQSRLLFVSVDTQCRDRDDKGRIVLQLPETEPRTCSALLEFLYRDHIEFAPIKAAKAGRKQEQRRQEKGQQADPVDPVDLLVQANCLGLQRVVSFCELHITKLIEDAISESIERAEVDIVAVLNLSTTHNARQLEAWCLHFIASNYGPMSKRREWADLSPAHRAHIEANQWPPVAYFAALEQHQKDMVVWEDRMARLKQGKMKVNSYEEAQLVLQQTAAATVNPSQRDAADEHGTACSSSVADETPNGLQTSQASRRGGTRFPLLARFVKAAAAW